MTGSRRLTTETGATNHETTKSEPLLRHAVSLVSAVRRSRVHERQLDEARLAERMVDSLRRFSVVRRRACWPSPISWPWCHGPRTRKTLSLLVSFGSIALYT